MIKSKHTYRDFGEIKTQQHALSTVITVLLPEQQDYILTEHGWEKYIPSSDDIDYEPSGGGGGHADEITVNDTTVTLGDIDNIYAGFDNDGEVSKIPYDYLDLHNWISEQIVISEEYSLGAYIRLVDGQVVLEMVGIIDGGLEEDRYIELDFDTPFDKMFIETGYGFANPNGFSWSIPSLSNDTKSVLHIPSGVSWYRGDKFEMILGLSPDKIGYEDFVFSDDKTEIGMIYINNKNYSVYAPNGGGGGEYECKSIAMTSFNATLWSDSLGNVWFVMGYNPRDTSGYENIDSESVCSALWDRLNYIAPDGKAISLRAFTDVENKCYITLYRIRPNQIRVSANMIYTSGSEILNPVVYSRFDV